MCEKCSKGKRDHRKKEQYFLAWYDFGAAFLQDNLFKSISKVGELVAKCETIKISKFEKFFKFLKASFKS